METDRLYRLAHQDEIHAYGKAYYQSHKQESKLYNQIHYKKNRERKLGYAKIRYARGKEFIHKLKEQPCMDCHIVYPPYVMQFDHRDPKEKSFGISGANLVGSIEVLQKEVDKCDLVCANCHAERTFNTRKII